ncbi:MAG TPA: patatin-like phospholipase family protein [Pyrinomonadaceae bacterium]|nr:patatin-like phospholipase family protein [Pyrinomonadaceae bacterium]
MKIKTKTRNIPLYLYQVLEEEYESLHGVINPEGVKAYLPNPQDKAEPLEVQSKRGWDFWAGHIRKKERASFISMLTGRSEESPGLASPYEHLKRDLVKYLRIRLLEDNKTSIGDSDVQMSEAKARQLDAKLEQMLNEEVLADVTLYNASRFSYRRLSDETRGLLSLRESGVHFEPDDIKHLNRLLLEDALPKVFHKISDIRLAALNTLLHGKEQSALCLSGGGIRSGTFALGLMQGLARHELLGKFDYLSTVSGGGYTGSWLTAWIHRHPEGLAGVTRDLSYGEVKKVDPDPAPLQYLRRYSNFITPKVGLLTADTWTFIGIYLRNTLLNLLVFIPLLVAVLLIPRLLLSLTLMQPEVENLDKVFEFPWLDFRGWQSGWHVVWLSFYSRHIFLTLGLLLGSWSLAYIIFNRPGLRSKLEERRPWFLGKTGQGGFLWMCLLPLVASAFCLTTYFAWSREVKEGQNAGAWKFWVFGIGFTFLGWLIASVVLKRLRPSRWRESNLLMLGGLLVVGLLGGTIFYVLAQTSLGSPVINYNDGFNWLTTYWLNWKTEIYLCIAVPLFLMVFLLTIVLFIGLTSASRIKFVEDEDREWWARLAAWVLISIIVWSVANVLVIFGPIGLLELPKLLAALGGLSGLITLIAGRSAVTPAAEGEQPQASLVSKLMGGLLPVLALFFLAFILAALSLATSGLFQGIAFVAPTIQEKLASIRFGWLLDLDWLTNADTYQQYVNLIYTSIPPTPRDKALQLIHMNVLHHTWTWCVLVVGLALAIFGIALSRVINLNIFSLHGGYRNRLIRAFLGASRPNHARKPNPFTGFDPADNLHMHELRPTLLDEADFLKPEKLASKLKAAMKLGKSPEPAATTAGQERGELTQSEAASHAASLYLVREEKDNKRRQERLQNARVVLQDYAPDSAVSQRLLADLRADLNTILKVDCLYAEDFAQPLMLRGRARAFANAIKRSQGLDESADINAIDRAKLRTDYHILLNRLVLEAAYPGVFKASTFPTPPYKLMHVINTTLNLVGGNNLAWQQRKAEPFSISPLHSGCFRVGYRNSRDYGGRETNGISIGTAATASGAAASSNMGYYTTSPVISLLLTLFNVRLGLWLGNPGPHGQDTYHLGSPRLSFKPVVSEAFGLTDDTNGYIYLTDGGHFENLALYEMVLRRCHFIVVSDGAQDGDFRFGDLGNAVRKIRIDFGVPIEFTDMPIYPKSPPAEEGGGTYWAIARIRYSCVDTVWDEEQGKAIPAPDGMLLYLKPTLYGDEPRDVLEYKKSFPTFPHQSTGDQFFDEPQFESYRMLGSHVMDKICGEGHNPLDLRDMFTKAFEGLEAAKPEDLGRFQLNREFVAWMKDRMQQWNPAKDAPKTAPTNEGQAPGTLSGTLPSDR